MSGSAEGPEANHSNEVLWEAHMSAKWGLACEFECMHMLKSLFTLTMIFLFIMLQYVAFAKNKK